MSPYFPLSPCRVSASAQLPGWAPIAFCRMEARHWGLHNLVSEMLALGPSRICSLSTHAFHQEDGQQGPC